MPSKQVVENTCDRCTRVWYVDAAAKPEEAVGVHIQMGSSGVSVTVVKYDCLCAGCTKTVTDLVKAIAKDMKKSSPVRGAKKKAEGGAEAPPSPDSTAAKEPAEAPAAAPHVPPAAAKPPVANHAGGKNGGGQAPPPGGASAHPTKS